MEARLPGEGPGGGSAVDEAWRTLRARLSGPLGCLAMLLCFPFALVAFLVVLATAAWRTRGLRRRFREQVAAQRTAAEDEPVLRLVRAMALDESFTREEALQAGVSAASGRTPADLLDEAIRRGWVVDLGGGRLAARPPG